MEYHSIVLEERHRELQRLAKRDGSLSVQNSSVLERTAGGIFDVESRLSAFPYLMDAALHHIHARTLASLLYLRDGIRLVIARLLCLRQDYPHRTHHHASAAQSTKECGVGVGGT